MHVIFRSTILSTKDNLFPTCFHHFSHALYISTRERFFLSFVSFLSFRLPSFCHSDPCGNGRMSSLFPLSPPPSLPTVPPLLVMTNCVDLNTKFLFSFYLLQFTTEPRCNLHLRRKNLAGIFVDAGGHDLQLFSVLSDSFGCSRWVLSSTFKGEFRLLFKI